MKKILFLLIACLGFSLAVKAQDAGKEAVKRTVETYLFSEEDRERRQTLFEKAKIYSTNPEGNQIVEKSFSNERKSPKAARVASLQKIVSIDVFEDAASVKVETDLSSGATKIPKHFQFISLLKINGEWKIVSILMPKIKAAQ